MTTFYVKSAPIAKRGDPITFLYDTSSIHLETKEVPAPWSGRTASGYGRAIPTGYMVFYARKWRRVYCAIFSNNGTLYIRTREGDVLVDSN